MSDSLFHFTQTKKSEITIANQKFTHCIEISQLFTKVFVFRYQISGNYFVIQLLNLNANIHFTEKQVLLNKNQRNVFIYDNPAIINYNSESPIKLQKNAGIAELSDFFNNISVDREIQNQLTASIFYSLSPFQNKTITRNRNKLINPDNSIEGILKTFGGKYFKFQSKEEIDLDQYPFEVFSWMSPYFDMIVESEEFDKVMTTIELDSTFDALEPYRICIPVIIYRNTGIPLGILASIEEYTSLYSMFFESLKELDRKKPNPYFSYFQKFVTKNYLTDEHRSFIKLQKEYKLNMYNCFVHLIRTIGANSLLGFFISDLLYTYSEKQWNDNLKRMKYIFKYLFNEKSPTTDTTRFDKVAKVLGEDAFGNPTEQKLSYAPLFKRANDRIPTCTNHIESLHKQINTLK